MSPADHPSRARAGVASLRWALVLAAMALLAGALSAQAALASRSQIRNWTLLLRSDDPAKRSSAATSLLATGDENALRALLDALSPAQPEGIRVSVITAFGVMGDDRAVPEMVAALEDQSQAVREAAASALQSINTPHALAYLTQVATDTKRSLQTRSQVVSILGATLDIDVIPTLITLLSDDNETIRQAARAALERITLRSFRSVREWQEWWEQSKNLSRQQMLAELVALQNERIQSMRLLVERLYLQLLAERKDKQDPAPLIQALAESDSTKVRLYAIQELAPLKGKPSVEALEKVLQDADPAVRRAAADALGVQGDPEAGQALIQALQDVDASVRAAAAGALGVLKVRAAVDALCDRLSDPSAEVAAAAARALGELADPKAVGPLVETFSAPEVDPKVYEEAVNALAKIKDPASAPVLIKLLASPREKERWVAVESLGGLRVKEAVPHLAAVIRNKEEKPPIREAALAALAKIRDPTALDTVAEALGDEDSRVSDQAFRSLMQLAGSDVRLYSRVLDALIAGHRFALAEKVLAGAAEQLSTAANPGNDLPSLQSRLARGLMEAGDWTRARPLLEAAVNAVPNEPTYMKDLAACLAAMKDHEALLALLARTRRSLPNEKRFWWEQTLKAVQALAQSGKDRQVLETVDALEKESPDLGGGQIAEDLRSLRDEARARLGVAEGPSTGTAATNSAEEKAGEEAGHAE